MITYFKTILGFLCVLDKKKEKKKKTDHHELTDNKTFVRSFSYVLGRWTILSLDNLNYRNPVLSYIIASVKCKLKHTFVPTRTELLILGKFKNVGLICVNISRE